jgi:pyridoxamine 5'-phosphate oxidase
MSISAIPGASLPPWFRSLEKAISANKADRSSTWLSLATARPAGGRPAVRTVVFRGFVTSLGAWVPPCGALLSFATDARSQKAAQLDGGAEVAWYFSVTREQYRIGGGLALVAAGDGEGGIDVSGGGAEGAPRAALAEARTRAWEAMSDGARGSFAWPPPGAPRTDGDAAFVASLPLPRSRRQRAAAAGAADDERSAAARERGAEAAKGAEAPVEADEEAALEAADARAFANFALLLLFPADVDHLQLRPSPVTQRRTRWEAAAAAAAAAGPFWGSAEEVNP